MDISQTQSTVAMLRLFNHTVMTPFDMLHRIDN